jgi:hypothetical protein
VGATLRRIFLPVIPTDFESAVPGVGARSARRARPGSFGLLGAIANGLEPAASEPCSNRASVPVHPPSGRCPGRCSPDLPPLRGPPVRPLGSRPPLVCLLHPLSAPPEDGPVRGFAALQGLDPAEPGSRSRDRLRPPWGFRPLPLPLAPSRASGLPAVSFARAVRVNTTRSRCRGVTLCAVLGTAFAGTFDLTSGD